MDYTLNEIRKKTVINIADGKKLGKVTDIVFSWPNGKVVSLIINTGSVNLFCSDALTVEFCEIEKIGEDAIFIKEKRCESHSKPECDEE